MSDLHSRIQQQYASDRGRSFYKTIMGDGGFDIHYGLYRDEDTTMQQATQAASMRLFELATEAIANAPIKLVLDLGSGRGGPAHFLASTCHGSITCVDLCQEHHDENLRQARAVGIEDQITTVVGNFESLPIEWTERFDLVWGQESFCHSADMTVLLKEGFRVTRPGGTVAFSDIMISDTATEQDASAFSNVNAIMRLSTSEIYRQRLEAAGFREIRFEDWTEHLETNFRRMLEQIRTHRESLRLVGVEESYLEEFAHSLQKRIRWTRGSVLRWGAFTARKI